MAPEVAAEQMYTKSVDLWAIGIIMHLATTGKHPFLKEHDSYETFKEKLKSIQVVNPDPNMSELAQNLFSKLVAVKPHQRYNVQDCLQHPWITRNLSNDIPLSFLEKVSKLETERKLHNQIKMFVFFSQLMANDKAMRSKKFKEYKEKIYFFSNKIEKWHKKVTMNLIGTFEHDEDFDDKLKLRSPNKFSDSSSSEEGDDPLRSSSQVYKQSTRLANMTRTQKNKVSEYHKTFASPLGRVQTTTDTKQHIKKSKVFEMTPSNQAASAGKGNGTIFAKKHVKMRAAQYASYNKEPKDTSSNNTNGSAKHLHPDSVREEAHILNFNNSSQKQRNNRSSHSDRRDTIPHSSGKPPRNTMNHPNLSSKKLQPPQMDNENIAIRRLSQQGKVGGQLPQINTSHSNKTMPSDSSTAYINSRTNALPMQLSVPSAAQHPVHQSDTKKKPRDSSV